MSACSRAATPTSRCSSISRAGAATSAVSCGCRGRDRGRRRRSRPEQVRLILDSCASWDQRKRDWDGSVRDRLLWALLAETGMRLGETLALQHRDWHTGLGETPFVEVVPREDHPHGLRVKNGGYRRIYISDELDRLYGEYLWRLCDAGADRAVDDLDSWWVFVNLAREPRFAPLRAETVAWQVRRLRRRFPERAPGRVHAALASPHARHGAAVVGDRRACRQPPPRSLGHPDDAEPLRLGFRGRRAAHRRAVAAADGDMENR